MLRVEVVSPESITYSGDADMVVARTVEGGDVAFQSGHIPFLGVLQISQAKVIRSDGEDVFAVHRGFVQVSGDQVTILSDMSEERTDIDVARAEASRQRATEALASDPDDESAAEALARAEVRLSVANG